MLAATNIPMTGKKMRMIGCIKSPPWCRLFFCAGAQFPCS
jgi:hypothetical protein